MASFTLHIQYVDRPPETRTFANRDRLTIGRDIGDIALRDSQVSGRHGEITFQAGVLRFVDLGSTNGSFLLDGRRVSTIEMTPGMAIRLGNSLITVQMIDSPLVGKGRTMIAGGGVPFGMPAPGMPAPSMPAPGMPAPPVAPPVAPPAMGSAPVAPPSVGTLNSEGQGIGFAPTSAMPQAAPDGGFAQPVAKPPGAPPPGFPAPPVTSPEISDDDDAVPTNPVVTTGSAPQVQAGQGPIATGSGSLNSEEFVDLYKQTFEFVKPVWIPAALIVGSITVPVALASGLLGFIPVVGPLLVVLLGLGQAVLMPLAIAALHRFLLGAYLNHPVDWISAWKEQIANAKMVWLSFFVAGLITAVGFIFLIIPGILLGSFIGLIYFCEGKRMVDINLRNLEIAKQEP
ncbi:MAG TPA: FHA domain-containing protein, partial [Nannocystis exedens]|nr:FHA domain-containing protein [Nannocystis exedens]